MIVDLAFRLDESDLKSRIRNRVALKRPLPRLKGVHVKGREVTDVYWEVGKNYVTEDGIVCTLISHKLVLMDHISLVLYSNGAVRYMSPTDSLYEFGNKSVSNLN